MNDVTDDSDIAAQLRNQLDPMAPPPGFVESVRLQLRRHAEHRDRRRRPRRIGTVAVSLGVTAAFAIALYAGLGLRHTQHGQPHPITSQNPQPQHTQPVPIGPNSLTAGPPASIAPTATQSFLWFTGQAAQQSPGANSATHVDVLDWTGQIRYQFVLPTTPNEPTGIQSVSADGTRALLLDGTVIDETGTRVGSIAGRGSSPFASDAHWLSDDSGICVATSSEPTQPPQPSPPTFGATPAPTPGADHSVTLTILDVDGHARSVATVGGGSLGEPSGNQPDIASVLSCSRASDLAVVARYHDATDDSAGTEQTATNMMASLWAIQLSTGKVLFHQPETKMALGRPFFFGSLDGKLAVEFLWNSVVAGSEVDRVIHIPSGLTVPVTDYEPAPDTPALSADGTRILRRVVYPDTNQTSLELIDAATGNVIRRLVFPSIVAASAVAEPVASSFMVQVNGQLVFMDGQGGITEMHPPAGVAFPWRPGAQG